MDLITGLDINTDQLIAISACTDMDTYLITGVVTMWGTWDASAGDPNLAPPYDQAPGDWVNIKGMNVIGQMAGLSQVDDNAILRDAGLGSLNEAQDEAMLNYWYQEASPTQRQWYLDQQIAYDNDNSTGWKSAGWTTTRSNLFDSFDTDGDGKLSRGTPSAQNDPNVVPTEGYAFLENVRGLDGKSGLTDRYTERVDRQWDILSKIGNDAD